MASLACGSRLSLRNQYDTKTPRARISFCCARQTDGTVIRAIRRPSHEKPGHARVTKKLQRGFRNVRRKLSSKKEFEKLSQRSRITAGLLLQQMLQTAAKSFSNVALGQESRKPS